MRICHTLHRVDSFVGSLSVHLKTNFRWQCDEKFLIVICSWRLISVVGTSIEEKHSRTALENKKHPVGSVRISLANRLPMLERQLSAEPLRLNDLLFAFDKCRTLSTMVPSFGLEEHPRIVELGDRESSSWKRRNALKEILYHHDTHTAHRSLLIEKKFHEHMSDKQIRAEAKFHHVEVKPLGFRDVLHTAMREHFKQTCSGQFFSISYDAKPQLIRPDEFYGSLATKALTCHNVSGDADMIGRVSSLPGEIVSSAIVEHGSPLSQTQIVFQVGSTSIGRKKTMRLAPASGRSLRQNALSIISQRPDFTRSDATSMAVLGALCFFLLNCHLPIAPRSLCLNPHSFSLLHPSSNGQHAHTSNCAVVFVFDNASYYKQHMHGYCGR